MASTRSFPNLRRKKAAIIKAVCLRVAREETDLSVLLRKVRMSKYRVLVRAGQPSGRAQGQTRRSFPDRRERKYVPSWDVRKTALSASDFDVSTPPRRSGDRCIEG